MKALVALLMALSLLAAFPPNLAAKNFGKQIRKAARELDEGRLADAKQDLEAVLNKKPGNEDAKILMSVVHYRLAMQAKKFFDAPQTADELRAAIALDPDEAYWHAALVDVLARQGDKEAAEKECSEAARLSPLDSGLAAGCGLNGKGELEENLLPQVEIGSPKPAPGVTPPVPLSKPEPPYSKKARKVGYQGMTVLMIEIGATGNVESASVVRPLGVGMDEEALKTVRTWTFKPATRDGKPVPVRVQVEVAFRLY